MPGYCCIKGCRANRTNGDPRAGIFSFPKNPHRKSQWEWAVQQLHDPNFEHRTGNKICVRHFEAEFVVKEHRATRDDGTTLILPRKHYTLTGSAVPTLFEFLPDPLPDGGSHRQSANIQNLKILRKELPIRLQEHISDLNVLYSEELNALSIFKVEVNERFEPEIKYALTINVDLKIHVVHCSSLVQKSLEGRLCKNWNSLKKTLQILRCLSQEDFSNSSKYEILVVDVESEQ